MATNPVTLLTLNAAQTAAMALARTAIDAELRLRYEIGKPIKIRHAIIDNLFDENPLVLETLLNEYEAAGWVIIKYESDDQGRWYSFYAD